MRVQIITNPNRTNEISKFNTSEDTTMPSVSTSLKPINKKDATLEAEKDELVVAPDLSTIHKILGKPHSQGGTPLNLEEGSFIFSKDKSLAISKNDQKVFNFKMGGSVKKEDNTPAKVLLRQVDIKHHNQMNAILNNKSNRDFISKNTAKIMLDKNAEKIGQVAYLQEAKKDFKSGVPSFSEGTQPIYSQDVKDKIVTEEQYAKLGGDVYKPKMAPGGIIDFECPCGRDASGKCLTPCTPQDYQNVLKKTNTKFDKAPTGYNTLYTDPITNKTLVGKFGNKPSIPNNTAKMSNADWIKFINSPQGKASRDKRNGVNTENYGYIQTDNKTSPLGATITPLSLKGINIPTPETKVEQPVITPNTFTSNGQYTNQKVPFNTGQIASLVGSTLINGMRKNIYPTRTENTFIPIELEKVNANTALQDNTNNWLQSARIAATMGTNPSQSNAFLQRATIEGLANGNKIRDQYDTQNVQIGNQQNQYNNQGFNAVRAKNVDNNQQYVKESDLLKGRINQEKITNATNFLNTGLDYYGQNLQMQNALNTMQQYGVVDADGNPVIDPKTGKQKYNTAYSTDFNGNFKFNNVSGMNVGNGNNTRDLFSEELNKIEEDIKNAPDAKTKAYLRGIKQKYLTSKQNPLNKYGGYIKRK